MMSMTSTSNVIRKPGRPRRACVVERTIEERNRIVLELQWVVRAVAKSYRGRGVEWDDLVSEGQLGLLRAVELYDPSYGKSMAAYAAVWVRQAIAYGAAARGSLVSVPHGARCLAAQFCKAQTASELEEEPINLERFLALRVARHRLSTLRASLRARGLRRNAWPENQTSIGPSGVGDDALARVENRDWVESALGRLPAREAAIVRARFGINTARSGRAFRDISRDFGIGPERTRQLSERALKSLRAWAVGACEVRFKNDGTRWWSREDHNHVKNAGSASVVESKKSVRKDRLMTQAEVADALGISRRYVVRWARAGASDFPKPVKVVRRTYLFSRREIESWALDRAWAEARKVRRS